MKRKPKCLQTLRELSVQSDYWTGRGRYSKTAIKQYERPRRRGSVSPSPIAQPTPAATIKEEPDENPS